MPPAEYMVNKIISIVKDDATGDSHTPRVRVHL
jgi:hypothetical protein